MLLHARGSEPFACLEDFENGGEILVLVLKVEGEYGLMDIVKSGKVIVWISKVRLKSWSRKSRVTTN